MMSKKSLIIIFVSLFILFSLFSIVSSVNAAYDQAWDEGYFYESHKSWFTFHSFNCTVIDKYYVHMSFEPRRDYAYYLVDANGKTGFFELNGGPDANRFQIGDKLTINGSMVDEPRNNHYFDSNVFGKKYDRDFNGKSIPKIRFNQIKLADGFVRGSGSSTDRYTNAMRILKATIVSGENQEDQTNCTVLIGKGYAGESVKISVLYSCEGKNLNQGNKVPKTVSDSGKIKVPTADGLTDYPDKAIITIYDSDGNKLDTQTVTLEINSEPQTFKFYSDPEYASNGAKFVGYGGDGTWANYYKDGHYYTVDGELIG